MILERCSVANPGSTFLPYSSILSISTSYSSRARAYATWDPCHGWKDTREKITVPEGSPIEGGWSKELVPRCTECWQLILVPSTIVVASTSLCFHGGLHLIAIDDLGKNYAHGFCRGRKTCATSLSTPNPKLRDHSSGWSARRHNLVHERFVGLLHYCVSLFWGH